MPRKAGMNRLMKSVGEIFLGRGEPRRLTRLESACRELGRRYSQNKRLLQEFPWLWAIRPTWNLALYYIRVSDSKEFDLSTKVMEDMDNRPRRILRMLVHGYSNRFEDGPFHELVASVWEPGQFCDRALSWKEHLKSYCWSERVTILHLIVTCPAPDLSDYTMIIRPAKPFDSFDDVFRAESNLGQ